MTFRLSPNGSMIFCLSLDEFASLEALRLSWDHGCDSSLGGHFVLT